jgi:uncharacterized protein (TIGR02271 family)
MAAEDAGLRPMTNRTPDAQGAEVVRSEEQLRVGTSRHAAGRVRVAKRVVTEERTVTVTVRREVLVVEQQALPANASDVTDRRTADSDGAPVLELTLSEEQVRTEVVVVPRERVRVFVDRVTGSTEVTEQLAREVIEVDEVDGADELGAPSPRPSA